MNPMTELDVAKGIQGHIANIDLDDRMGREAMLGLISAMERSLDRIKAAEWDAEEAEFDAQQAIPIEPSCFDDYIKNGFDKMLADTIAARQIGTLTEAEEEAFDELEQRASHVCPVFAPKGVAS